MEGWRGNRLIVLCEELVIMFIAWEGGEAEQLSNRLLSTMSAFSLIQFNMGTAENYFIIRASICMKTLFLRLLTLTLCRG